MGIGGLVESVGSEFGDEPGLAVAEPSEKGVVVGVLGEGDAGPVVQAGSFDGVVGDLEFHGVNEMQVGAHAHGGARNVAGVLRNGGVVEDKVDHGGVGL